MSPKASALPIGGNQLLAGLSIRSRAELLECCEPVDLVPGAILCRIGRPFRSVLLPLSGYIALVSKAASGRSLAIGMLGREGVLGAPSAERIERMAPVEAVVLGLGRALRLSTAQFRLEAESKPRLRQIVDSYHHTILQQFARLAACAHFHETGPRLAQWLLLALDRAALPHLDMTHQTIAVLLGVRRSSVSLAAEALQRDGLIRYARGTIHVLDRSGLERMACSCYPALLAIGAASRAAGASDQGSRIRP